MLEASPTLLQCKGPFVSVIGATSFWRLPSPAPPPHPPPCPVWFTKVALALHLMFKLLFLFDSNSVCPAEMLPTKRGRKPSIGTNGSHRPFLQNQMSFHVL